MNTGDDSLARSLLTLRTISAFAVVVGAIASVFVYHNFTPFTLLAVGGTLGFATYAVFGPRARPNRTTVIPDLTMNDPRVPGVFTVLFFLLSTIAVLSLLQGYYTKPLLFYVATAGAGGILLLRVLLTDAHRTNVALAFLFGLLTFVSNQLAYPLGLNGPDSGLHRRFSREIAEHGFIGAGTYTGTYTGFPGQHLLSASTTLLAGSIPDPTYRAVAIVGMLLVLPMAYLIARPMGGRKFAVITMLVFASMDYVVYRVGHPSKMAYALPLLLLVFMTVLYIYRQRGTPEVVVLFALFATALVFTHIHTAMVAFIMLFAIVVGQGFEKFLRMKWPSVRSEIGESSEYLTTERGRRGHALAAIFGVIFFGQTLYYGDFYGTTIEILYRYFETLFLFDSPDDVVIETAGFAQIPDETLLINTIGSGLLLGLVTLGVLDSLQNRIRFTIVILAWLVIATVYMAVGVIADVPFALPNRVYVIVQMTAFGFFGTLGLTYLLRSVRVSRYGPRQLSSTVLVVGVVYVVLVFGGFVFFSTASAIAGEETTPFDDGLTYRMWFGMTEQQAANEFATQAEVTPEVYRDASTYPFTEEFAIDYSGAEPGNVIRVNEFSLSTGYTVEAVPGRIGASVYAAPTDVRDGLTDTHRFYDNGAVELYAIPSHRATDVTEGASG